MTGATNIKHVSYGFDCYVGIPQACLMFHMDLAGCDEAGVPPSMMCSFFPMLGNLSWSRPMKGDNGPSLRDQSLKRLLAGWDLSSTYVWH